MKDVRALVAAAIWFPLNIALSVVVPSGIALFIVQVAILFGNVVVVELIFAWPGIGLYTAQSVARSDFPAIAGVTLVLGVVFIIVNAMIEVLQAWTDPRIRAK